MKKIKVENLWQEIKDGQYCHHQFFSTCENTLGILVREQFAVTYSHYSDKLIPSRDLEYELACLHLHSVWIALCFVDHLAICTFYLIV